jgi:hypothetical protein
MVEGMEQWKRWERTRAWGRNRWIWIFGVCGWGLPMALMGAIFVLNLNSRQGPPNPLGAVITFIGGLIGGYIWGAILWSHSEASYLQALQKAKSQAADRQVVEDLVHEVAELRRELRKSQDDRIRPSTNQ